MKNKEKDAKETIWAIEPQDSHSNNCIRLWKEELSQQEDWVPHEGPVQGFWKFDDYEPVKKIIGSINDKGLKIKVYFKHKKDGKDYTKLKHWTLYQKHKKTVAIKKASEV